MKPRFPIHLIGYLLSAGFVVIAASFTDIADTMEAYSRNGIMLNYDGDAHTATLTSAGSPLATSGDYASAGLTFTFNLTALKDVTSAAPLLTFHSTNDISVWMSGNKELTGGWKGAIWTNGGSCGYTALAANPNVYTENGNSYLTLTASMGSNGLQLFDAGGNSLLNLTGLKSTNNKSVSSISLNTDYIDHVAHTTGTLDGSGAQQAAEQLQADIIAGRQEPTANVITNAAEFWERAYVAENTKVKLQLGNTVAVDAPSDTAQETFCVFGNAVLTTAGSAAEPADFSISSQGNLPVQVRDGGVLTFTGLHNAELTDNSITNTRLDGATSTSAPMASAAYVGNNAVLSLSGNTGTVRIARNQTIGTETRYNAQGAIFLNSHATLNLNNNEGGAELCDNRSYVSGQYATAYGAALYVGTEATANLRGNASLVITGNSTEGDTYGTASGGAIYLHQSAVLNITDTVGDVLISSNRVSTRYASATAGGGAIYGAGAATVTLSGNQGNTEISDNSAVAEGNGSAAQGGAIVASSALVMNNNAVLRFSGNSTRATAGNSQGGAVKSTGALSINGNGRVEFIGNHADGFFTGSNYKNIEGGAIFRETNTSTLSIEDNGTVLFQGNYTYTANSTNKSSNGAGGAIYATGNLSLSGNDSVTFTGNYEQRVGKVVLSSVYHDAHVSLGGTLSLSAKEGGDITFYDRLTSRNTNGGYISYPLYAAINGSVEVVVTSPDGVYPRVYEPVFTQTGSGDVVFSGARTEADLNAIKSSKGLGAATRGEIEESRYNSIEGETRIMGGRLIIEDAATLYVHSLTAESGSTLVMRNGAMLEVDVDLGEALTLKSGSTLLAEGTGNYILSTQVHAQDGSQVCLNLTQELTETAQLTLGLVQTDDSFLGGVTMTLNGLGTLDTGSYKLLTLEDAEGDPSALSTDNIILTGEGADRTHLRWDWDEMTLFYDHEAQWEIIVDNATGDLELTENKTADVYVRDAQHFTLAADLRAGGQANGGIMLESGTAELAEGSSIAGSVTFAGDAAERTLKTQGNAALQQVVLEAATGTNIIHVAGEQLTVNALGGNGDLTKAGSGTLLLRGESALQGDLTLQDGAVDTATMRFSAIGEAGTLSGVSGVAADSTELSGGTGQQMLVELLAAGVSFSLHELVFNDAVIEAQAGVHAVVLNNISLDAGSSLRLNSAETLGTLNGANTVQAAIIPVAAAAEDGETEMLHLYSDQLDGFTLAGGSLTLTLTDDIWAAAPDAFAVTFNGLQVAADAAVTYALGGGNVPATATLRGVEATQGGVTFLLATVIPEPATATLSLLALSMLGLRRRRALQR